MNETTALLLSWVAGLGLGAMFYGGLWLTLCKAVTAEHPGLWFAGSLLGRMGLTLSGLYFVADGRWQRMLLCLLGMAIARAGVTRLIRSTDGPSHPSHPGPEAHHATQP